MIREEGGKRGSIREEGGITSRQKLGSGSNREEEEQEERARNHRICK